MPLILAPTLEAEAGIPEFEAGLVYTVSPGQPGLTVRPCFKKQMGGGGVGTHLLDFAD